MVPALILGNGLTALGAMRVLHRAGIPFYIFGQSPGPESGSRWYRQVPMGAAPLHSARLPEVLDRVKLESAVLIPCSDSWARQAAGLSPVQRSRFPVSLPSVDAIETLVDKARFGKLLADAGVPHPFTQTLTGPEELAALPDGVLEGAFLKPHDSQSFFARFGVKAFQITSRAEATRRMAQAKVAGFEVLLQQYIPGPSSMHYFVDGFVDAAGSLKAAFVRRRLRMFPPDFGNSSAMVSVPSSEATQAIESIRAVLERLHYRGIFSAEFKRDPRDGAFKLLEVNARAWWYVEFAARCGVDVCALAYRDALGQAVPVVRDYRVGERLVYPYYDYFACRAARAAGALSVASWVRSWVGAQQPLFNWTDPWPALGEAWEVGRQAVLRRAGWGR